MNARLRQREEEKKHEETKNEGVFEVKEADLFKSLAEDFDNMAEILEELKQDEIRLRNKK